jgi:hypothetical protein
MGMLYEYDKLDRAIINNEKNLNELLTKVREINKDADESIEETDAFIKNTEAKMKALGIKF